MQLVSQLAEVTEMLRAEEAETSALRVKLVELREQHAEEVKAEAEGLRREVAQLQVCVYERARG